jgi:ribonucleoside-diphosphate reductase alpha chain
MSGVSFLPYSDHVYQQAPFQEISEDDYEEWVRKTPEIDWSRLSEHEKNDMTVGSQEVACVSGGCEIL